MSRAVTTGWSALAVSAAATIGSLATNPKSAWYRMLDKPAWQPPGWLFPVVWTGLYADIAATSGAVLDAHSGRDDDASARGYTRALAVNLLLNAGWSVTFFGLHRQRAAVPVAALLAVSSADLARRAHASGAAHRGALVPYVAWTTFATALTAEIARRNPS